MSKCNDYQVGGKHYNRHKIQHWDFVEECELSYLDGCSTKYISRWRDKNGVEDLRKASHYISKAIEKGYPKRTFINTSTMNEFTSQLPTEDASIIQNIVEGEYEAALLGLSALIFKVDNEGDATSEYVNQDR